MNILVDKEGMLILRKLENVNSVLSKLAELECPHIATSVCYCDQPEDFAGSTDLELKLLIKNANGPDMRSVFSRSALMKIVHAMVTTLPVCVVNAFEVDMQLRTLESDNEEPYLYVHGSMKPKLAEGLTEHVGMQYSKDALGSPATLQDAVSQATPATSAPDTAALVVQLRAQRTQVDVHKQDGDGFSMPREGTSTHTIFMFCAQKWKEANYVDNKALLDDIRKKAVETLVPQGLNVSTVRTQAARWYQYRQRLVV
jgi:hypothetical protein